VALNSGQRRCLGDLAGRRAGLVKLAHGPGLLPAGTLLWLDADMTIRNLTHGAKSLDDFAVLFFAPPVRGSPLAIQLGSFALHIDDLVRALNTIAPYDWKTFWDTAERPGLRSADQGLTAAGYDYVYQDTPSANESEFLSATHAADHYHSIGLQSGADGAVKDVWWEASVYCRSWTR